jgi:hypothetical protein
VPGERKGDRHHEQHHAREPVHLARELVGSYEKSPGHVNADEEHHRRRPEIVHAAQDPAKRRLMRDESQVSYAFAVDGIHAKASAMPVTT